MKKENNNQAYYCSHPTYFYAVVGSVVVSRVVADVEGVSAVGVMLAPVVPLLLLLLLGRSLMRMLWVESLLTLSSPHPAGPAVAEAVADAVAVDLPLPLLAPRPPLQLMVVVVHGVAQCVVEWSDQVPLLVLMMMLLLLLRLGVPHTQM